ncbi:bifunctional DNA-binding transcriptional regulator/O6-methylguanine-DNA methyltransferase Ada [Acuticoccus sediminis]|uniref:methylated-DNA--[protein]-cysteine S-methyltransferase n=2 Tax=Acuticoccus sediminis TaxID=2184697 RepID=A0A8B2P1U8_9HYPH|nr:bifunctional DNA-binding transcriptional regulator/O6-methylguanine-DNA methyltransferase Ada [Acuticoccus sediminis]
MTHEVDPVPEDPRWIAVCDRDAEQDGAFVYAVATTGVYCRPSCPSRRPLRRNVSFFALTGDAEAAGYRPCRRCRPTEMSPAQRNALMVEAACRSLAAGPVPLAELAEAAGVSAHHFHRTFKAHTGTTPAQFARACRARRAAEALAAGDRPAGAAFAAGFASLSRFYDEAAARFTVHPSALARGGRGEVIVVTSGASALGIVTVAFSRQGIAAVRLTDTEAEGRQEIDGIFRDALVVDGGEPFEALLGDVLAAVEEPSLAAELPVDIRGTAFEERVWGALRDIPIGTTASYAEVAAAIGAPTSHRAVARACGANRIAVLVPCHRVVRADGSLAGYRWGVERKKTLLAKEAAYDG